MSDFESGAFNRALPPLRVVTCFVSATCDLAAFHRFRCRTSRVRFGIALFLAFTSRSTAEAWCSGARWEYRMTIWSVLWPSSSATVRRSTPAITSLLAKVWRLQRQGYPRSSPLRERGETNHVIAGVTRRFERKEDRHRFHPPAPTVQSLRAATAIELRGIVWGLRS